MSRINVATSLNSLYVKYTYVMLTSLFMNNKENEVHVYLLYNDLTNDDIACLSGLAKDFNQHLHPTFIDKTLFPEDLPTTEAWTIETYFRLMLIDILPTEVDRLLYLDVDMIINKPLNSLYDTDFESKLFCACKDMGAINGFPENDIRISLFENAKERDPEYSYFNAGMMLWNLEELRGKYCFKSYMNLAKEWDYKLLAPDQDLLNYMHIGEVKYVDEVQYNLFSRFIYSNGFHYEDVKKETTIIHFPGIKPWEGKWVHYDIEKLWWDYAKLSPFYTDFLEKFVAECIEDPMVYNTMDSLSEEKRSLKEELEKCAGLIQKLSQFIPN